MTQRLLEKNIENSLHTRFVIDTECKDKVRHFAHSKGLNDVCMKLTTSAREQNSGNDVDDLCGSVLPHCEAFVDAFHSFVETWSDYRCSHYSLTITQKSIEASDHRQYPTVNGDRHCYRHVDQC